MKKNNSINRARTVLDIEAQAIRGLKKHIDGNFAAIVQAIAGVKGRVILSGMGKPGFIAQKISATLSSTGTPSLFLHPAEASHGDMGRVTASDCVIAFSNSGETEEVCKLIPVIKKIGALLIAFTGNTRSTLAKNSDYVINTGVKKEACSLGLAPTASTTAMLAMGDALAVSLLELKGFAAKDFALFHPGGSLGKQLLLKVEDIMRKGRENPLVKENESVRSVLVKITNARAGSASVVDNSGRLSGIFTDGDLRRHINGSKDILNMKVKDVMTKGPVTISAEKLAAEALTVLRTRKIDELPVVDPKRRPVGLIDVQDLLKAGIV